MSFPPPPTPSIDWNKLGTKVRNEIGHVESHYSVQTGTWSEPEFVQDPYLRIHGLAPGLNYGQQAFEGMKGQDLLDPFFGRTSYKACFIAYRSPDNKIQIFRPDFHATRMAHSASFVSIPPLSSSHFQNCVRLAVAQNAVYVPPHDAEALLYIRPVVFGSSAEVALCPPEEFTFCVYVQPGHSYHGVRPLDALILEGFDRAAPNGTGTAKVGGNYAPVMRWSGKARSEGYGITLHLDSKTQTEIDEFSTSGFVGVRTEGDNHTLVVPDSSSVIESVTSDSCLQVAKSLGWKVEKRSIKYEELPLFSEVMAVGTAAALLPIKSITRKSTSDKFIYQNGADQPGPCTVKLSDTIKGIQKGKIEDTFGWCVRVEETKLDEPKFDVQMSGDANVEAPKTDEQIVDADVTVEETKANEEPKENATMNEHAVVGEPEIQEQLKVQEKASGVVRVEEPTIVEDPKIEETRTECVNVEDAKAEEAPKVVEQTEGYVRVEEAKIIEALAVEKLHGYVRVEETRVDELLEVQ